MIVLKELHRLGVNCAWRGRGQSGASQETCRLWQRRTANNKFDPTAATKFQKFLQTNKIPSTVFNRTAATKLKTPLRQALFTEVRSGSIWTTSQNGKSPSSSRPLWVPEKLYLAIFRRLQLKLKKAQKVWTRNGIVSGLDGQRTSLNLSRSPSSLISLCMIH
jgi:hypothetical protein